MRNILDLGQENIAILVYKTRSCGILIDKVGEATMEEEIKNHRCIICEQDKSLGIMICSEFLCDECEAEMVRTDVKDAKYPFFVHQMNKIWYKQDA
jgi:hypothetical protein